MKVDDITGGAAYGATPIAGLDAQRRENELSGARRQVRHHGDRRETKRLNDAIRTRQGAGRVGRAIKRNGCWTV